MFPFLRRRPSPPSTKAPLRGIRDDTAISPSPGVDASRRSHTPTPQKDSSLSRFFSFLRFRDSHSNTQTLDPADPQDTASTVSQSICLDPSRLPFNRDAPRKSDVPTTVATPITPPLAAGKPSGHPNSAGRPRVHRARGRFNSLQPLQAPRPITPTGIVSSSAVQIPSPPISVSPLSAPLAPPSNVSNSALAQHLRVPQPEPHAHAQSVRPSRSLNSELPSLSPGQFPLQSQGQNQGVFNHAHDFELNAASVTFAESTTINFPSNQFMKELLEKTIPGAEFDSSDRDPPPRCHPGTRLAILARCLDFIRNCHDERKVRWVVGAAGVGKSAVMQNVIESPEFARSSRASVFFSINGRNDGKKAIITISYQLAARCELYRQLIEKEITRDPSLLRSSMAKQFLKLIVEPFIENSQLNLPGRALIIIDGLDECRDPRTEKELLRLICDLCITYPSSPLVWLIASRPEQHIDSFFSAEAVAPAYEKEEIPVDSDEARADVEKFLRDKLDAIKRASKTSLKSRSEWPEESHLWKLANAAGGLFAYADTVVRYVDDPIIGSPALQLTEVMKVIDHHPMTGVPREEHPMASLDALYRRILSNAPSNAPPNITRSTRKLLLALASGWDSSLQWSSTLRTQANFVVLCNWLDIAPDEAYAAIQHLHSVLRIPSRDQSHTEKLQPFHKSFIDFISDILRSGFAADIKLDARRLRNICSSRILKEVPNGIDFGEVDYKWSYGTLRRSPGIGDTISLKWLVGEEVGWNDNETRVNVYKLAIETVVAGMNRGDLAFQKAPRIRLLTDRFEKYGSSFPSIKLHELVFDDIRRHEFIEHGLLKSTPLKIFDVSTISSLVKLQFRRPAITTVTDLSDPRISLCDHVWAAGEWEEDGQEGWTSFFGRNGCAGCLDRLKRQLRDWKMRSPDHTLLNLFTSTGECCVECSFVDPDDGVSEWTYWFQCRLSWEERTKYASAV